MELLVSVRRYRNASQEEVHSGIAPNISLGAVKKKVKKAKLKFSQWTGLKSTEIEDSEFLYLEQK